MRRSITMAILVLAVAAAFGLYQMSNEVRRLERELGRHNDVLLREQAAIQVLRAEWAYLNRPEVLQRLSGKFLPLEPLAPSQVIASLSELPERGLVDPAPGMKRPMRRPATFVAEYRR